MKDRGLTCICLASLAAVVTAIHAQSAKQTRRVFAAQSARRFESEEAKVPSSPLRNAYFGDLHLHTSYAMDAYMLGTIVDPDGAYRFARGETVSYLGAPAKRRNPLDFVAVTDHAESLGIFNQVQ